MWRQFVEIPIILAVPGRMHGRLNVVGNDDYLPIAGLEGLLQRSQSRTLPVIEAHATLGRQAVNHKSTIVLLGIQPPRPAYGASSTAAFLLRNTSIQKVFAFYDINNPVKPDTCELNICRIDLNESSEIIFQKEIPRLQIYSEAIQFARQQLQQLRVAA